MGTPSHQCSGENASIWVGIAEGFQVSQLEAWGYTMLPTVEKTLVCGDKGLGAMADLDTIVSAVKSQLDQYDQRHQDSS